MIGDNSDRENLCNTRRVSRTSVTGNWKYLIDRKDGIWERANPWLASG